MNPLDVPDDANLGGTFNVGSASVKGEGLKVKYWSGSMPGKKGTGMCFGNFSGHSAGKESVCVLLRYNLFKLTFFRIVLNVNNHELSANRHHLLQWFLLNHVQVSRFAQVWLIFYIHQSRVSGFCYGTIWMPCNLSYPSAIEIQTEIKDPEMLVVPPLCVGQPLEDTPEGTVNSFLHEFM